MASSVAPRTPEITAAGCRERAASTALDAKLQNPQRFSARAHAALEQPAAGVLLYSYQRSCGRRTDDRFALPARQRRSLWVFCSLCASRAAMKTCFVLFEQAEKPALTRPESCKRISDRKRRSPTLPDLGHLRHNHRCPKISRAIEDAADPSARVAQ